MLCLQTMKRYLHRQMHRTPYNTVSPTMPLSIFCATFYMYQL